MACEIQVFDFDDESIGDETALNEGFARKAKQVGADGLATEQMDSRNFRSKDEIGLERGHDLFAKYGLAQS